MCYSIRSVFIAPSIAPFPDFFWSIGETTILTWVMIGRMQVDFVGCAAVITDVKRAKTQKPKSVATTAMATIVCRGKFI